MRYQCLVCQKGIEISFLHYTHLAVWPGWHSGRAGARILRGLCLNAEVQGLNPTCDDFLHVFPPLSPLSHLACPVLSNNNGGKSPKNNLTKKNTHFAGLTL